MKDMDLKNPNKKRKRRNGRNERTESDGSNRKRY